MSNFVTPLTLGQVFKTSFKFYKAGFWKTLPIAVLLLMLSFCMKSFFAHQESYQHQYQHSTYRTTSQVVVHAQSQTGVMNTQSMQEESSQEAMVSTWSATGFYFDHHPLLRWALCLLGMLVQYWLMGALYHSYEQVRQTAQSNQPTISFWKSLRLALFRLPVLIPTAILALVLMGIAGLFSLYPALILGTFLFMMIPTLFLDQKGIGGAIKNSLVLVHRHFWQAVLFIVITWVVIGICSIWQFPEVNPIVRVIFGLLYLVGLTWTVALTYSLYLYLKERAQQPSRQQLYALIRERPKAIKAAAWCMFVYVLITFVSSIFIILTSQAVDDQTLYALIDQALATNFLLSLTIVFMCFAYVGGNASRMGLMILNVIFALLCLSHLTFALMAFRSDLLSLSGLLINLIIPVVALVLNIMVFILMLKAKYWYKKIRAFYIDLDLAALKAESQS